MLEKCLPLQSVNHDNLIVIPHHKVSFFCNIKQEHFKYIFMGQLCFDITANFKITETLQSLFYSASEPHLSCVQLWLYIMCLSSLLNKSFEKFQDFCLFSEEVQFQPDRNLLIYADQAIWRNESFPPSQLVDNLVFHMCKYQRLAFIVKIILVKRRAGHFVLYMNHT